MQQIMYTCEHKRQTAINTCFILYAQRPKRVYEAIFKEFDHLNFLHKKLVIRDIDTLIQEERKLEATILSLKPNEMVSFLRRNKQPVNGTPTLRTHHTAWKRMGTGLIEYLIQRKFYAHASLNLRMLALNLHGGIYTDTDIASQTSKELLYFQETFRIENEHFKKCVEYLQNGDVTCLMRHLKNQKRNWNLNKKQNCNFRDALTTSTFPNISSTMGK